MTATPSQAATVAQRLLETERSLGRAIVDRDRFAARAIAAEAEVARLKELLNHPASAT